MPAKVLLVRANLPPFDSKFLFQLPIKTQILCSKDSRSTVLLLFPSKPRYLIGRLTLLHPRMSTMLLMFMLLPNCIISDFDMLILSPKIAWKGFNIWLTKKKCIISKGKVSHLYCPLNFTPLKTLKKFKGPSLLKHYIQASIIMIKCNCESGLPRFSLREAVKSADGPHSLKQQMM